MSGTEYVIEQLGQALKASHEVIARQAARIAELETPPDPPAAAVAPVGPGVYPGPDGASVAIGRSASAQMTDQH